MARAAAAVTAKNTDDGRHRFMIGSDWLVKERDNDAECADTKAAGERAAGEVPTWDTLRLVATYELLVCALSVVWRIRMTNVRMCGPQNKEDPRKSDYAISPFTTDKSFYVARYCTGVAAT